MIHLVLSTRRVLATALTILLQCFLSAVTSLSSASFIPVTSCISSLNRAFQKQARADKEKHLNDHDYNSQISALCPEGRCTSCFRSDVYFLSTLCGCPRGGSISWGQGGGRWGLKIGFSCGRYKWMTPPPKKAKMLLQSKPVLYHGRP